MGNPKSIVKSKSPEALTKIVLEKLTKESPELYQELSSLLQEKETIENSNQAWNYVPNGKAEEFIKLVGGDKCFVSLFVAANGVGKSAAGVNVITNILFGPQNDYFKLPLFESFPYEKRGRIISDPTTIKEKILPELNKWFPANETKNLPDANFEESKEGKNYVRKITTNTGWTIDIMSTEQDAKEFESTDLGFVWIDEPMPKDKFMATLARGRMGMVVFWTFTPLTYSAWIKEWMDAHCDGVYADYVEAEAEDNCKVHGVRGILEHAHIKRISDGMPDDEKEARLFGKFGHLIGRIHKDFKRKIHVVKPFALTEKDYTVYKAIDPHPRVADHVLYMAVDRRGTKYLVGELLGEGSIKLLHERMRAFEESMHYRIENGRIIDPSAFNDDQHRTEKSVGSQLFDLGEVYIKGSKDLMAGIKRTNDALAYEVKEGKMFRPPELYVFDTCAVAIKQIEEYVWQEWKGASKDEKKLSGRPIDKNDHQVENLHRLLLFEPAFVPYQFSRAGENLPSAQQEEDALNAY